VTLVDVVINLGILGCISIILFTVYILWRRGEFDDQYHDLPTQRFTISDTPSTNSHYPKTPFRINAPTAGELMKEVEE